MEQSSKLKLALGAASLFLFIVGVKRTFRSEDGQYVYDPVAGDAEAEGRKDIPDRKVAGRRGY